MYLSFYNLKERPFQISTDPKFLWMGEIHREALATLKYGIQDNKGFLFLTGDVGTGKTTLINSLLNSLDEDVIVAVIPDPNLENIDLFKIIANDFKIDKKFDGKGEFLLVFREFLYEAHDAERKVLLIIDESQRLGDMLLEEIRLLSNIEKQNTKLINIFFVGQQEFNDIILKPENKALRQRITANYSLSPLTMAETDEYIKYRLSVAGADKFIFNTSAVHEIFLFSEGYPRLINTICDRALLTGYVQEEERIDSRIISECAQELRIESMTDKKDPAQPPIPEMEMQPGDTEPEGGPEGSIEFTIIEEGDNPELEIQELEMQETPPQGTPPQETPPEEAPPQETPPPIDQPPVEIDEKFLTINAVEVTFDKGPAKGERTRLAVSAQEHNILTFIIPDSDKKIIEYFGKGSELGNLQFFSPIAVLTGKGIVSENMEIAAGPEKGNFQIDINITSI